VTYRMLQREVVSKELERGNTSQFFFAQGLHAQVEGTVCPPEKDEGKIRGIEVKEERSPSGEKKDTFRFVGE